MPKTLREPLLLPAILLGLGIVASHLFDFSTKEAISATLWLGFLCLFAFWRGLARASRMAGIAAFFFLGIWTELAHGPKASFAMDSNADEVITIEGCVVEPPSFSDGRERLVLEMAPGARMRLTLNVREGQQPPRLHYGERIETGARVRKPHNFGNPGAFDLERYLANQNIYWTASSPIAEPVKVLGKGCGTVYYSWLYWIREMALDRIESLYPNDVYASAMMQAILLGETGKVEQVWTDYFRRTGTYHALVISGMHLTVLTWVLLELMRAAMVKQFWRLGLTLVVAWTYALVSGATPPVIRGAGGFTLFIIAGLVFRRTRLLNCLAGVMIPFLLYDPRQLFEASFQLSFLCVAAIGVFGVPALEATTDAYKFGLKNFSDPNIDLRLLPRVAAFRLEVRLIAETVAIWTSIPLLYIHRFLVVVGMLLATIWETITLTFVIQVALAVPMVVYFHRLSVTGLTANILIVPALTMTVPIGFAAMFTGWHWLAQVARWLLDFSQAVAAWHIRWEPSFRIPTPPLWLALACVCSLTLLAFMIRRSHWTKWLAGAVAGVFLVLLVSHPFPPQLAAHQLEMTTIDVGQGDSVLLVTPAGKTILVDAGGFPQFKGRPKPRLDIGEDVVSPYLWSRSIRHLDVVVLTHAHEDHSGGIVSILENFRPKELWVGAMPDVPAWQVVRDKANALGVTILRKNAGEQLNWGDALIQFLAPNADYEPGATVKNNDSLAFQIAFGERKFLLTGDIEKQVEARMAVDGVLQQIDVLKVPHHGSKTSSTQYFLEQTDPTIAMVSAGLENRFHHPHPDVVERFHQMGTAMLRTDQLGLVSVFTDGKRLRVESFHWQATRAPLLPVFSD